MKNNHRWPQRILMTAASMLVIGLVVGRAQSGKDQGWEDPERVTQVWNESMSGESYLAALRSTGMMAALERGSTNPRGGGWIPIGPIGETGGSGYNGRIAGIQIYHQGANDYVYVGACAGGLWRALLSAGPSSWQSIGEGLPNPSVRAFAINPNNPQDIIVGTGDYERYVGAGLFRTTNSGSSWSQLTSPLIPRACYRIVYAEGNPSIIVVASDGGLMRSIDGGANWAIVLSGHVTDIAVNPNTANGMLACVMGVGIEQSTDDGATWTVLSSVTTQFGRASLAICPGSPTTMALVVENNDLFQGVFRSTNGGSNWNNISGTLANFGDGQIGHAQAIAFRPNNANEIYVGAVLVARTTNSGGGWTVNAFNHGHDDITQLYFNPITSDSVMWVCNDGGVFRYSIGDTTDDWNGPGGSGLRCAQVDFLDAQRAFYVAGLQDNGILRSTESGGSWTTLATGDGFDCEITDDLTMGFWYSTGIFPAPVTQEVYKQILGGPPEDTHNFDSQTALFYDPFTQKVYSPGVNRLNASPVSGTPNWSTETTLPQWGSIRVFGDLIDGQTLYINNNQGPIVTVCRRNGSGWDTTSHRFNSITNSYVSTIFPSTEVPGEAWAGLSYKNQTGFPTVFHTTDFGVTWQDISDSTLRQVNNVQAIVTRPLHSNEIYVGTSIGMFHTTDGGGTWTPFQDGLPVVLCTDLRYIIDPSHGGVDRLVLSTYGRGVYQRIVVNSPIAYVNQTTTGFEDGTFEHPYHTFMNGLANANGGTLGLRGNQVFHVTQINQTVTLSTYGGMATIQP